MFPLTLPTTGDVASSRSSVSIAGPREKRCYRQTIRPDEYYYDDVTKTGGTSRGLERPLKKYGRIKVKRPRAVSQSVFLLEKENVNLVLCV